MKMLLQFLLDPHLLTMTIVFCLLVLNLQFVFISCNQDEDLSSSTSLCNRLDETPVGISDSSVIPDQALTSSSSYNEQSVGPQFARLNRDVSGGAWCPQPQLDISNSGKEWIQVNLTDQQIIVTSIATQGRFGNGMGVEYMEDFWIEYSRNDGLSWYKWKDRKANHLLQGNADTYTPVKNTLDPPIIGPKLLRIYPFSEYLRTVCVRFELYGCKYRAPEKGGSVNSGGNNSKNDGGKLVKGGKGLATGKISGSSSSGPMIIMIYVGIGLLSASVLGLMVFLSLRFCIRSWRLKKHCNNFYNVDVDFINGQQHLHPQHPYGTHPSLLQHHHPTSPGFGPTKIASTPIYSEPEEYPPHHQTGNWRSRTTIIRPMFTSGNNHHQQQQSLSPQNNLQRMDPLIPHHEYAVPDVLYQNPDEEEDEDGVDDQKIERRDNTTPGDEESELKTRLLVNPLQEVIDSINRIKAKRSGDTNGGGASSSSSDFNNERKNISSSATLYNSNSSNRSLFSKQQVSSSPSSSVNNSRTATLSTASRLSNMNSICLKEYQLHNQHLQREYHSNNSPQHTVITSSSTSSNSSSHGPIHLTPLTTVTSSSTTLKTTGGGSTSSASTTPNSSPYSSSEKTYSSQLDNSPLNNLSNNSSPHVLHHQNSPVKGMLQQHHHQGVTTSSAVRRGGGGGGGGGDINSRQQRNPQQQQLYYCSLGPSSQTNQT